MSLASVDLPSDPEALRIFAAAMQAELVAVSAAKAREIAARDAEIHAKTLHIEKLKAQLAILRRARFGRSSEKLEQAIEQLELLIGDLEEGEALSQAQASAAKAAPSPAEGCSLFGASAAAHAFAARDCHAPGSLCLPELRQHGAQQAGRGRARGARICAVLLQGRAPRPAADELPSLRDDQPGAGTIPAHRARPPRAGAARARPDREILRSYAVAPAERHLRSGWCRA
jgi:Transposase C of IS166 homeodomain